MSKLDSIYAKLPVWAQHTSVSLYGYYWRWLRFGAGYQRFLHDYLQRENFPSAAWDAWQQARLLQILEIASTRVPYYRSLWGDAERAAARAGRLEDLPLLEKSALRKAPQAFLNQGIHPRPNLIFHTSGSTGTPIETHWTVSELRDSLALREARGALGGCILP